MTIHEIRELFIKELTMPSDKLKIAHPTIWNYGPQFVDYDENGRLTLSFPIKHEQRNGYHLLQGGVLSSFIDDVFGLFVFVVSNHNPLSTVNMNVNYHKGVTPEIDHVLITSSVIRAGRRIVTLEAEVRDPEGDLVATCQSNLFNVNKIKLSYLDSDTIADIEMRTEHVQDN